MVWRCSGIDNMNRIIIIIPVSVCLNPYMEVETMCKVMAATLMTLSVQIKAFNVISIKVSSAG